MTGNEIQERWLPVVGEETRYEVSDQGRVRRLPQWTRNYCAEFFREGALLKPYVGSHGYALVDFRTRDRHGRKANGRMRKVHNVVMEAFVGPQPEGMDVCHNNGIKTDNRLVNLRYDTRSANGLDAVKHGANVWSNKTHCPKGHPYDAENTGIGIRRSGPKKGSQFRMCRKCSRARTAEYHAKKRRELLQQTGTYFRNQAKGQSV